MLTGERTLDDLNILRNVVCFSRDAENNLLFSAGPVRSCAPVPRSILSSESASKPCSVLGPNIHASMSRRCRGLGRGLPIGKPGSEECGWGQECLSTCRWRGWLCKQKNKQKL